MENKQKSTALYPHPFSKAYWRDAAAELKSTKMLVIAALMIALRVATKGLSVPIAPNLDLFNLAAFINALGAMIMGPVLAIPAAFVSDFLGVMIWDGGNYFLPYALTEIASSLIWALLLYRAKVNTWRVMLGRFLICVLVNLVMGSIIYKFYLIWMGTPVDNIFADMLTMSRILKNLFMFPIESVVMTLFLSVLIPVTFRMKLTYHNAGALKFSKVQIVTLAVLFCIGLGCVGAYGIYNYNTSNQASWLSADDTYAYAASATEAARENGDIEENQILVVSKVYKKFGGDTTIDFKVYTLTDDSLATETTLETYLYLRAAKIPKEAPLEQVGTASAGYTKDQPSAIFDLTIEFTK